MSAFYYPPRAWIVSKSLWRQKRACRMQTPKADISDSSEKLVSPTARLMRGWFPLTVNPRDCVLQPRVARKELPWEIVQTASQPQRGCGPARHPRTQFRLGWLALARCTQGSSQARNPGLCRAIPSGLWRPRFQISKENAPNGGLAN